MSNTTRRHPRTLQEAFGPYTDGHIQPLPSERQHALCDLLLAVIAIGVIAAICIGVI